MEFDRTEAARTGSVGVRHADVIIAVGISVPKRNLMKTAQMTQPAPITGASSVVRDFQVLRQ